MKRMMFATVLVSGVLAVSMLSGCGGGGEQASSAEQQATASSSAAQQQEPQEKPAEPAKPASVTVYALDNVPVRAKADKDAEKLTTIPAGTKLTVKEVGEKWTSVTYEKEKGYVSSEFLTEDKEKAEKAAAEIKKKAAEAKAAAEAEAAERAAAQEAAEAKAAAEAAAKKAEEKQKSSSSKSSSKKSSSEKSSSKSSSKSSEKSSSKSSEKKSAAPTVVSKVKVPDCDNPEHGYYEITYSDGTVKTEDY